MPEELTKYLLSSTPSLSPKLYPGAPSFSSHFSGNDSQGSPWYGGDGARAPQGVFTGAVGAQHREAEGGEDQGPQLGLEAPAGAVEAQKGHPVTTKDGGGAQRGHRQGGRHHGGEQGGAGNRFTATDPSPWLNVQPVHANPTTT